ncbi:Maf family nucleotide pyrophosphatase [Flavobacterium sp.]|uniref:Maf family nucleotide pyrophosphatase n=1 Tax=Flavobacterium sp. TaxID=239 RepID=UPI0035AE078F
MLKDKLKKYHVILASGSPRRQQFFKELGIDFEIRIKEIEEVFPEGLLAEEITNYLAKLKAEAFTNDLIDNDLLITSDTIVWLDGKALGKPKDFDDAVEMLLSMSGKTHEVITSVCFKTTKNEDILNSKTKVTFNSLTKEQIHHYLNEYKPFDKAGAYGIQDWIGLTAISKIEGSYTNVVGLPTDLVFKYLDNL